MFHRLFYYRVLSQFRIGAVLFWNLLFPILLSTFLFLAMSGLMFPEKNDPVSIQVDNAQVAEVFAGIENRGVKLYRMEKTEDPKAALESGTILAYIPDETPLRVVALRSDWKVDIVAGVLDVYQRRVDAVGAVMAADPLVDVQAVVDSMLHSDSAFLVENESAKALSVNYFYTILAMVCLGANSLGIINVYDTEARFSPMGKRLGIVPHGKLTFLLPFSVASIGFNMIFAIAAMLFQYFVLGIPIGDKISTILLLIFVGSLLGLFIGMTIGLLVRGDVNVKIGVGIGVYLTSSFLAGMMSTNVKHLVMRHAPLVAKLNPSSLITDSFNGLYYFESSAYAMGNIRMMLIECAVLLVVIVALSRRNQYEYV